MCRSVLATSDSMWELQNTLIVYCRKTQTMPFVGVAKALWRHMTNHRNHSHDPQRPKTIIKRFLSQKCSPANQTTVRRLLGRDLLLRSPARLPKQLELQQNGLLWTHKRPPPFRHIKKWINAFDLDLLSDLRFVTVRGASFIVLRRKLHFIHLDLSALVIRPLSKAKRLAILKLKSH